jgi:hypothetical protein
MHKLKMAVVSPQVAGGRQSAWEAEVLPLDDIRKMPGFRRFYSLTV